jgi:DNA-directed RNA polymerase subunit RPC12/RpoP
MVMMASHNRCLVMALALLLVALAAPFAHGASEDHISDYKPARALLQSGTSCPNQIPGCMPRRCTTRTVDNVKDRYVCLRCKQGFVPVLSSNRKSIIQCSECLACR